MKPLEGITILDLGQFLSAPSATLRLADLGARVIKVERPQTGDICRNLYISDCVIDGDSSLFHAINRNKESVTLDFKDANAQTQFKHLVSKADAVVVNYRPGVAKRLGVDYRSLKEVKPSLVYGEITGYGVEGPWAGKPGQDLLVQSLSGVCWLNGNANQPPTPMGLSLADLFAGQDLAQGLLAGLLRSKRIGEGAYVRTSLLEAMLDAQFEVFTTYCNDGHRLPRRSAINNANAYIDAPYGIYATQDGYVALAMIPIPLLGQLIGCKPLERYGNPNTWHTLRDEIKTVLADFLAQKPTQYWLSLLEPADVWCANVLTWDELMESEAFKALDMTQEVRRSDGIELDTTCCPIRIDSQRYKSGKAAPRVGQDNNEILGPISEYFSNHAR